MDKAYMRSLTRETAEDAFIDMARTDPGMSWLFKAKDHGSLIELTAFKAQQLREGRTSTLYPFAKYSSEKAQGRSKDKKVMSNTALF